jgi:hypothetical protein
MKLKHLVEKSSEEMNLVKGYRMVDGQYKVRNQPGLQGC